MIDEALLEDAASVWCPSYPRRVSTPTPGTVRGWGQATAQSVEELVYHVNECVPSSPGFVSTYSFPRGHPGDDGIPMVDTIMWDFDRDENDDGTEAGWLKDMNQLLVRVRLFCQELIRAGVDQYWRASLSGKKGVHLYLDFPPIPEEEGSLIQFRRGIRRYSETVMNYMITQANLPSLDGYLDVSSGRDLSRLTRLPNTVHEGATERFGEPRYCVPVSIRELSTITPDVYRALTRAPRPVPDMCRRIPSERAGEKIRLSVRLATESGMGSALSGVSDPRRISEYRENENEAITVKHLKFHLSQKPCIWRWRENPKMFDYGEQSHIFEMNAIAAMRSLQTPIDTMIQFFDANPEVGLSAVPDFDREYTRDRIETVISRNYAENTSDDPSDTREAFRGFNCKKILEKSPAFCLGAAGCRVYQKNEAEFDAHQQPERVGVAVEK